MGSLKTGRIDINDATIVTNIRDSVNQLLQDRNAYYLLRFKPQFYFETLHRQPPSEEGWYIILDEQCPLYVGKAEDLNARLNTNNGSIDNFANKKRAFDAERNFIKKLSETNVFQNLRVCIIQEKALCLALGLNNDKLTKLDKGNIEKIINISKGRFAYL
jgi:predicted GIY-YIG superfamily endonuclease